MSVTSVAAPTVVVPPQLFAPSVPSTQAIAMALTSTPVAAKEATSAAVAMAPSAGNALHAVSAISASAASASATSPRASLLAGTAASTPSDDPSLGRHVDLYL